MLRRQRAIEIVPGSKPLRWRRYDVPQHLAPETSDALRFCAVEGDLDLPDRRHRSTIEADDVFAGSPARDGVVGIVDAGAPDALGLLDAVAGPGAAGNRPSAGWLPVPPTLLDMVKTCCFAAMITRPAAWRRYRACRNRGLNACPCRGSARAYRRISVPPAAT